MSFLNLANLPSNWRVVCLGKAIELAYGKSLPKGARSNGRIPVYGSNGIAGWHNKALVNEPTIIVGRKGSAGAVQFVEEPCYPIDTTYFVRVRPEFSFDLRFLFYLLRELDLSRLRTATGVPGLTRDDAYQEQVPVPPLDEQRRLVDILSRAEGIVRLRREAQKKAAELIPALFLDMFGDPATNPKGWAVGRIAEVCAKCSTRDPRKTAESRFIYIDISAVDPSRGQIVGHKEIIGAKAPSRARQVVHSGDVVISTVRPNLRATALIPNELDKQICSTGFCVIRPTEHMTSAFLYALARSNWFVEHLMKKVRGAQYPAVTDKDIFGLNIPVPPIKNQTVFSERFNQIISIQSQQETATQKAQATFDALLARTFGGL